MTYINILTKLNFLLNYYILYLQRAAPLKNSAKEEQYDET